MQPPFLIEVPHSRYFVEDHCANCLEPLPEDVEALFCSSWCSEVAESVRYQRRVFRDGRIEQPDVREAIGIRNALLLAGGYKALGRTLTVSVRAQVKARDHGRCTRCGKPGVDIDHIDGNSGELDNLQLLCVDCHRAKTAENLVPASPEHRELLKALFVTRVLPDDPRLLADDEVAWATAWRGLKSGRRKRFVDRLTGMGIDLRGLKSRAEMVLELEDYLSDAAVDSSAADDYDGGLGPDSYFAAVMRRDT